MKAVILAGGQGKRLRPITNSVPKPLINIGGKPIVVRQIEWLKNYGVEEFILSVGYLKEKFMDALGSGRKLGVHISYVVEEEPLGTGGGLRNARLLLDKEDCFYVLNGDIITDINLSRLLNDLKENDLGVIALVPLPSPYGIVEVDKEFKIIDFKEKPRIEKYWINAGVYLFKPEVFNYLPDKGDIEKTAFPILAKKGMLRAVKYEPNLWKSIDTYKDIEEVESFLQKLKTSPKT